MLGKDALLICRGKTKNSNSKKAKQSKMDVLDV
jgi:hypothetical protein